MKNIKQILKLLLVFLFLTSGTLTAFQNLKAQNILTVSFSDDFNKFNKTELIRAAGLTNRYAAKQNNTYAQKLENYLIRQGYLFAKINRIDAILDPAMSAVNISINGSPGNIVLLGDIEIQADSIAALNYQNVMRTKKYDVYNEKNIESDIKGMLSLAADSGYVFAEAHIQSIKTHNADNDILAAIVIRINEGDLVTIDDVEVKGNSYTKSYVVIRELAVRRGDTYSKAEIDKIPKDLLNLGIFKNVKTPTIIISKAGKYILSLVVEEGNATTFDGVVGYIPDKTSKSGGFFTGLLDFKFNNLFGTARRFDVHWEKPDQFSENFYFGYTEPWVLDYPLDLSIGLERTLRDSTYLEWKGNLKGKWRFSKNLSIVSSIEKQVVLPDSVSNRLLRLARYEQYNIEVGVVYDNRDYPLNPRAGFLIENRYTLGLKNNFGPGYLLLQDNIKSSEQIEMFKIGFEWYYEMLRNQVLAIRFYSNQVTGDRLQLTDYFWFGGARTLRGYRENQFSGDFVNWLKMEYRFLLSRDARIFLFNDWGAYRFKNSAGKTEEILAGYGIGLRLDTALGIMAIDFGLGKNDDFSQAKIHFGIINRF